MNISESIINNPTTTDTTATVVDSNAAEIEAKSYLRGLMSDKERLESEIKLLNETNNNTATVPLVDSEGFPRSDLDIHTIRIQRHSLAQLQYEHQQLMKQIETALYKLHQNAKAKNPQLYQNKPQTTTVKPSNTTNKTTVPTAAQTIIQRPPQSINTANNTNTPQYTRSDAFYIIDSISTDSPASIAGLELNDLIVTIGSINKSNKSAAAITAAIRNSIGRSINITVLRESNNGNTDNTNIDDNKSRSNNNQQLIITVVPQQWSGQGLLGCHFKDI